ncbi:MAG: hypothetical protein ABIL58_03070 [Pseudomonadota bacterium]
MDTIRQVSVDIKVELITTTEIFHALSQPLAQSRYPMVVLIIDTDTLLDHFIANRKFLDGHRLLLVLPDCDLKTVSKAHQLFPRFITYLDSDFKDISEIVEKWKSSVSNHESEKIRREIENAEQTASTAQCR